MQILSAICAARPDRLQECILSAPLGVSRLVAILDDARDSVRSAGLLLLVDLTSGANEELRKIVAFEDVFGRIFALIQMEGGLGEAGITAQDCLSLLANLIKGSASNQTMFRESGCVTQLANLLRQAFPAEDGEAPFLTQAREKSAFGLLQLLRLFLAPGEPSTPHNQAAFFRAGIAQILINLAFSPDLPIPIRTAALKATSDLITFNHPLQEAFAALTVATPSETESERSTTPHTNGTRSTGPSAKSSARPSAEQTRAYIIEALLSLTLDQARLDPGLRNAGCNLIQSYLAGHDRIRVHFLQRAISGHAQEEDAANVLTALSQSKADANGLGFASWIVQDLVVDASEAKAALLAVKEGDESEGEEVLSFLQTVAAELEPALKEASDPRFAEAYACLLAIFLWDSAEAVDDVLAEGSSLVQTLAEVTASPSSDPELAGLSAVLLGTIYEFSTKDSPIPRRTLAPLLTQKLGRSKYLNALTELRRQPAIRDADLIAEEGSETTLCQTFVDLFQVEYSRLRKAIDKDPGVEVLPASAAAAGVDRDVLDDLRQQLQTSKEALAQAQASSSEASQKAEQVRMTTAKDIQTANAEVERLRRINQAMQQGHEAELNKLEREREAQEQTIRTEHQRSLDTAKEIAQRQLSMAVKDTEQASVQKISDAEKKFVELQNAHRAEQDGHSSTRQQLEKLTAEHKSATSQVQSLAAQVSDLTQRHSRLEKEHEQSSATASKASGELEEARNKADQTQSMLEMFKSKVKDLQDEVKAKDDELAAERSGFADLEKELETAKAELETARTDLSAAKKDTEGVRGQAEESKKRVADLEKQLQEVQKALDEAKKSAPAASGGKKGKKGGGADDSSAAIESLKKDVEALKKEAQEAREEGKSAREELESMLLVMGDIEAKRDEYRGKVKTLGGEVSEDDEDDEEEEEEGEDSDVD